MIFTLNDLISRVTMKKILQATIFSMFGLPVFAFANTETQTVPLANVQAATGVTQVQAEIKNDATTVISPRTGIRYTLGNTAGRPIVLKTAAVEAATPATANRIVASNPALSPSSQEKAKQNLLAQTASN